MYHRWGEGNDGHLERFYVALNFTNQSQVVTLRFAENGVWEDLLDDGDGKVVVVGNQLNVTLNSNWGHLFFKRAS